MPARLRTGRPYRRNRRVGFAVGTLCAIALCTGCTSVLAGSPHAAAPATASPPSGHPAPSNPTRTAPGAPFAAGRVYRVTSDRVGFLVTSRLGTANQQWRATQKTWTHTYSLSGSDAAPVIHAAAGSGASFIECTVSVLGSTVARIRAGGPHAKVECS